MIVERVQINYTDMPLAATPSFNEADIGKTYTATVNISLVEIDRRLRTEVGETPDSNTYVFKLNDVVSIVED